MELNKYEQYFIDMHKYLNEIGLVHWLIGSSLLGPIRDGHFIEGDREVNFGVMADDLAQVKPQLIEKYRVVLSPNISRISGVYLLDKKCTNDDLWKQPDPFTWLAPHYVSGDRVVQCVGRSHILYWEKDEVLPLSAMPMLDECFSIPRQSLKFLETYYGFNWRIRDPNWHWLNNSHNHINLEDLSIC